MKYQMPQDITSEHAQFLAGVMDCFYGLCIAISELGAISRDDLARLFETAIADQYGQDPEFFHPARRYPAQAMAEAFRGETERRQVS